jgi:hypothetical protein
MLDPQDSHIAPDVFRFSPERDNQIVMDGAGFGRSSARRSFSADHSANDDFPAPILNASHITA